MERSLNFFLIYWYDEEGDEGEYDEGGSKGKFEIFR